MNSTKQVELAPDEAFIQQAIRDGRCTIQEVSLKALGTPDCRFQARVKHLDMDHVHRLSLIHDQEEKLSPVVVFRAEEEPIHFILADGFHRHEVHRRKGLPAIRAYVIDSAPSKIEHEARLFAAMANQNLSLGRKSEDVRKAAEILLADPECWQWPDKRLAKHCGCAASSMTRYRNEYAIRMRKSIPTKRRPPGSIPKVTVRKQEGRSPSCSASIDGKKVYLGTDEAKAREKLDHILEERGPRTPRQNHPEYKKAITHARIKDWLINSGIACATCETKYSSIVRFPGLYTTDAVLTTPEPGKWTKSQVLDKPDITIVAIEEVGLQCFIAAVGLLRLLRIILEKPKARMIAVCYREDYPNHAIEAAEKDGIEFLSPTELVASLSPPETKP